MIRYLLFICLNAFTLTIFSQAITLNIADLQKVGQVYDRVTKDNPTEKEGSAGTNQVWDFSSVTGGTASTTSILDPATTPYKSSFTSSNQAITSDNTDYLYYSITGTEVIMNGLATYIKDAKKVIAIPFSDPLIAGKFPMTFGDPSIVDASKFQVEFKVGLTDIRVTRDATTITTIDGWGVVKTPDGDFKCLRVKVTEPFTQEIETKNLSGGWDHYKTETGTFITYRWLAKESGLTLVELLYESTTALQFSYTKVSTVLTPEADFQSTDNTGGNYTFTDQSKNSPDSWEWDFGDTSPTSNDTNSTHTYTSDGTYDVCLTVTNSVGTHTSCKTITITGLGSSIPKAEFTFSANKDTVTFTNTSQNNPTYYFWDFGDGTTDTVKNPVHLYTKDSTYQVCLYTNNNTGADTTCQTVVVTGSTQIPVVDFNSNFNTILEGETIDFSDLSTNTPDKWTWTFVGATTSTSSDQNPTGITYPKEGCYEVNLVAGNSAGSGSKFKSCYVSVGSLGVNSNFFSTELNLYPNPNNGNYYIESKDINSILNISIYNILGEHLNAIPIEKNSTKISINMTSKPSGIYYAKIHTLTGLNTIKVIIK